MIFKFQITFVHRGWMYSKIILLKGYCITLITRKKLIQGSYSSCLITLPIHVINVQEKEIKQ